MTKKILPLILIAALAVSPGTSTAWAENAENENSSGEKYLELTYDERYSFADEAEYDGYVIKEIESLDITSRQVSAGEASDLSDTAVLTQKEGSDTDVIATGVGTAVVTLGKEVESVKDDEESDTVTVNVTVSPAALTLMYVSGQSNAEGYCSSSTGYRLDQSIVCKAGEVYSTFIPSDSDKSNSITGLNFSSYLTKTNYADYAVNFVPGSLSEDIAVSGKEMQYSLTSMTEEGSGKTGPDSGLAYEWNQLTGDKVWAVNTAWGGSSVSLWIPGASLYERQKAVCDMAYETYRAEIEAGHYTEGRQLMLWLQGETPDKDMSAEDYAGYFGRMYDGLLSDFDYLDGIGMISVRSSVGSYLNDEELYMTAPRIVQYLAGLNSDYDKLFVVSNANEQWVSDEGVRTYFSEKYGEELSYPTRGEAALPSTVSEVHSDIHYSQIGHNENGITAAEGMYHALCGDEEPKFLSWRSISGQEISYIEMLVGKSETVVPVAEPIYTSKKITVFAQGVSYDAATGEIIGDGKNKEASLTAASENGDDLASLLISISEEMDFTDEVGDDYIGFYRYGGVWYYLVDGIRASEITGFRYGTISGDEGWWYVQGGRVTLSDNSVIKDTAGDLGTVGKWYYVVGSRVQEDFTGLANYKNDNGWWYINNGSVDFTYTGFSSNKNGAYYVTKGKVTFEDYSVIKDKTGAIGDVGIWYYVMKSQVRYDFTGLANYKNDNGWWYINNGSVDFTYTGFSSNKNGAYYVTKGKVTFGDYSVIKDKTGAIGDVGIWYYVVKSQVRYDFTGLANYKNDNGWWYINKGSVDFTYSGIAENKNGWWYIQKGKVDFSFNGTWTVVNGRAIPSMA